MPATRHPWPSLVFVLPLLAGYEYGVAVLGGAHPEALRNGADNWLRCGLAVLGLRSPWVPPGVLLVVFAAWARSRWGDRPRDLVSVLTGMALESVAFALGLWCLSRGLAPLLEHFGVELAVPLAEPPAGPEAEPALGKVITYLGAGIYEEALFRLVLFSGLRGLLRRMEVGGPLAGFLAALASATLFATAHHIGPYGQPYSNYLFLFRLAAGLYFALLYQARGFGVAVGSHACYNVMISVGAG
jgi:membrane protease YdiL (CAAX protease family)